MNPNREFLVDLGNQLLNASNEKEADKLYKEFSSHFSYPDAANLFYFPELACSAGQEVIEYEPTVEEVVDKAIAYQLAL